MFIHRFRFDFGMAATVLITTDDPRFDGGARPRQAPGARYSMVFWID